MTEQNILNEQLDFAAKIRYKIDNDEINKLHINGEFGTGKSFVLKNIICNRDMRFLCLDIENKIYYFLIAKEKLENNKELKEILYFAENKNLQYTIGNDICISSFQNINNIDEDIKKRLKKATKLDKNIVYFNTWDSYLSEDLHSFLIGTYLEQKSSSLYMLFNIFLVLIAGLFGINFFFFFVGIDKMQLPNNFINDVGLLYLSLIIILIASIFVISFYNEIIFWFSKIKLLPISTFLI